MTSRWSSGNNLVEQLKQLSQIANMFNNNDNKVTTKGWLCRQADCIYAQKGCRNYVERTHCNGCYRSKAVAQKPEKTTAAPKAAAAATSTSSSTTPPPTKETQRRETRARKREARRTFKAASLTPPSNPESSTLPQELGPVARAMAQQPKPAVARLQFSDDTRLAMKHILSDAASFIVSSLAQEVAPVEAEPKSASTTLTKFVGERGPTSKTAKKLELEAAIKKLNAAMLPLMDGDTDFSEVIDSMKAKIEGHEKERAKLAKDAPSVHHERMAIAEARSSYEVAMQARLDRETRGVEKSTERQAERTKHFAILRKEVDDLEAESNKLYTDNADKHRQRAQVAASHDQEVLALFDKKVSELDAAKPGQGQGYAQPGQRHRRERTWHRLLR